MAESEASYTLEALAQHLGLQLDGDPQAKIAGLATLSSARAGDLSFLANERYLQQLDKTEATAVIIKSAHQDACFTNKLIAEDPYLAFARATALFNKQPASRLGIHPSACIDPAASLGSDCSIGAQCTIEAGAVIGEGAVIGPGCAIGADSRIGAHSRLHANVSVYHDVRIGSHCTIHSGAVIGADGFGFANDPQADNRWVKIYQLGGVSIGDHVEIGAGTTVDRGALEDTLIGDGVIIDNQVQIAHNVSIGKNTAIAGCAAIAGSTQIGENCTIAGAVGIIGHLNIVNNVHITAMTLVTKSITEPGSYSSGTPMAQSREWRRNAVRFGQLDSINRRLNELEKLRDTTDAQS